MIQNGCKARSRVGHAVVLVLGALISTAAGQSTPPEDKAITPTIQVEIIDSVTEALRLTYVFPAVAERMEKYLRDQFHKKAYVDIASTREFADRLTEDLQSISHDRHLRVRYIPDEDIALMTSDTSGQAAAAEELRHARQRNFEFREIRIMQGNVGYLRFDGFSGFNDAGATAIAAMNFLANCDAVIFDMRYNGGGSPKMIQLVSSYLFEEPTHLNSFYIRRSDSMEQFWTQPHVSGPRLLHTDIYVLTSGRTFSAAEEFTYNLKNLKRGMIIGDTTGGGAHPVEGNYWANLNVQASIPFGRAVNPITGTNWEGTGVAPDLVISAERALDAAHAEALKKIIARTLDADDRQPLEWGVRTLENKLNPPAIDVSRMARYAGSYGPRSVKLENGALYYRRGDGPWTRMIPMSETLFRFDEYDYFRLEVVSGPDGQPVKLVGQYDDGHSDESPRSAP